MSLAVDKTVDGPDAGPVKGAEQLFDEKHGETTESFPEPTPEEERELLRKIDLTILPMVGTRHVQSGLR